VWLRSRLADLVTTPTEQAKEELEWRDATRRQMYGNDAQAVPVFEGSADNVYEALLRCVVADFQIDSAIDLYVEEVPVATNSERPQIERALHNLELKYSQMEVGYRTHCEKDLTMNESGASTAFCANWTSQEKPDGKGQHGKSHLVWSSSIRPAPHPPHAVF